MVTNIKQLKDAAHAEKVSQHVLVVAQANCSLLSALPYHDWRERRLNWREYLGATSMLS